MSVRIACIGAGNIASTHLTTLARRDDAVVIAVCDVDPEAARRAAAAHDARAYADHETLYAEEAPDAVIVAVPPFAHTTAELMAAERGIHLLVEKPLGLSRETPREVHAAVEDAGVITQVGYMNRYLDAVERAVELVDGRPLAVVDGRWIGGVPGAAWWRRREQSGGQVVEQSTHVYDLVRYVAGEVESVTATGGRSVVDEIDFEDATAAAMRHRSGAVSHVTSSCASPETDVALTLVGDDLYLHVDLAADEVSGTVDDEPVAYAGDDDAYEAELDAFLTAVREGDPSHVRSPYGDALRTFELTLAVEESLDAGRPVAPEGS